VEVYCELTLPATDQQADGERRTYDVTGAVEAGFAGDESWSVFDTHLKDAAHSTALPTCLKPRQVGEHGRLYGKSLRLQALAFVRAKEVKRTARCMEAQECDATTKVDASERHYFKVGAPNTPAHDAAH